MRRRSQPAILMLSVRDFHWWNVMTFLPFLSVVQIIKLSFSISKLNHSGFWQPRSAVHIEWVKFLLLSAVLGSLLTGFVSFWQWSLLMECAMYVYEYEHIYAVASIDMHYMHHRPHALLTHRPKSSLENLYIGLAFGAVSRPFINLYTHVLEPRHYTRSRVCVCLCVGCQNLQLSRHAERQSALENLRSVHSFCLRCVLFVEWTRAKFHFYEKHAFFCFRIYLDNMCVYDWFRVHVHRCCPITHNFPWNLCNMQMKEI